MEKQALINIVKYTGATVLPEELAIRLTAETREDLEYWTDFFVTFFSELYGGASVFYGFGGYVMEDTGKLIKEPSNMVTVSCPDAVEAFRHVYRDMQDYLEEAAQETIFVRINGVDFVANIDQLAAIDDGFDIHAMMVRIFGKKEEEEE